MKVTVRQIIAEADDRWTNEFILKVQLFLQAKIDYKQVQNEETLKAWRDAASAAKDLINIPS